MIPHWQTEIHDSEIYLLYKGGQAGVLFPHADFPVEKIRKVVELLNAAEAAAKRSGVDSTKLADMTPEQLRERIVELTNEIQRLRANR